jgi:hypothetical protein
MRYTLHVVTRFCSCIFFSQNGAPTFLNVVAPFDLFSNQKYCTQMKESGVGCLRGIYLLAICCEKKDLLSRRLTFVMTNIRPSIRPSKAQPFQTSSGRDGGTCFCYSLLLVSLLFYYQKPVTMRGYSLALLALTALATEYAVAFTPTNFRHGASRSSYQRRSMVVDMTAESDVSIPYDSASLLAYDAWLTEFKKGDFDQVRYEQFKANYEAITVSNIIAKKKAREGGDETSLLALNEYGDYSADEYEAMMLPPAAKSTGGVLGNAVAAAESQSEASSALQEASDALAEEEEVGD